MTVSVCRSAHVAAWPCERSRGKWPRGSASSLRAEAVEDFVDASDGDAEMRADLLAAGAAACSLKVARARLLPPADHIRLPALVPGRDDHLSLQLPRRQDRSLCAAVGVRQDRSGRHPHRLMKEPRHGRAPLLRAAPCPLGTTKYIPPFSSRPRLHSPWVNPFPTIHL